MEEIMRWTRGGRSSDIEDRRGEGGAGGAGIRLGGAQIGIGGVLLLLVLSLVFGQDFLSILGDTQVGGPADPGSGAPSAPVQRSAAEEELVEFVSFVLDDVQDTWSEAFQRMGREYQRARLVLFTDAVRSGCGTAAAAMGPFYCPLDGKVYIDLGFYGDLKNRFGAPGDFAQAYVLAHEVGHHVQNLLGISGQVQESQRDDPGRAAELSVRLELQADCLAGVWAGSTAHRNLLDPGDVEEAMGAAAAIGDDRIQKQTTGRVTPETWTHGSSKQRMEWFRRGMSGRLQECDTFRVSRSGDDTVRRRWTSRSLA
jgi:predicted metalloprotease